MPRRSRGGSLMADKRPTRVGIATWALVCVACGGGGGTGATWDERLADALAPKAESTALRLVSLSQPEGSTLVAEPYQDGHQVPALWATVSVTSVFYEGDLRIQVFMARGQELCLAGGVAVGPLAGEATVTAHPMMAQHPVTDLRPVCTLPYSTTEVVVLAAYKGSEVTSRRYPATYHFVAP